MSENRQEQLIYRKFAKYYDSIYSWKDYEVEAKRLMEIIDSEKKSVGDDLLEVGCGTAKHLSYLKKKFSCEGLDINEGILKIAEKQNPELQFSNEDMTNFDLGKKFDVILCLFSSIGYVKTHDNLKKTIENFSKHLKKGGILIIEPWFTKETIVSGKIGLTTHKSDTINIARMDYISVQGDISTLEMQYLVAEKNKGIQYAIDVHELGLFDTNKMLDLMKLVDLDGTFLQNGFTEERGLFVAIKL